MSVKNDIRMPRVPVLARRGLAVITISSLLSTGFAFAADDEAAILERIKPVGQVNVARAKAAAPAPATAAPVPATAAPATSAPAPTSPMAAAASMVGSAVSSVTETVQQAAGAMATAPAGDPQALAQSKGCLGCHQIGMKIVGPAYKDVAAKYKGDAGALDRLAAKVQSGGVGTWGQIPMPPNNITDDEARQLVSWILSL